MKLGNQFFVDFLLRPILSFFFLLPLSCFAEESLSEDVEIENDQSDFAIHGLADVVVKNDYITPRGLLVTNTGVTIQTLTTLTFDLYKNPSGTITQASLIMGLWNDFWTDQRSYTAGIWNEVDWYAGFDLQIQKNWELKLQYLEFVSPPGNFKTERNGVLTVSYNDAEWGLPITVNPYTFLFVAISGDSTVVVGRPGRTYYFEIGMDPTYDLNKHSIPLSLSMPTWITVGPANFWNGGKLGLKREKSHFGVFSTGIRGQLALNAILKGAAGKWYVDTGVQYYYLINDNLLEAQMLTLGLSSISHAHRQVVVPFAGIGIEF